MVSRQRVLDLFQVISKVTCRCPAHGQRSHVQVTNTTPGKEYAFEMASSTIRYGIGVTREVGMDLQNWNTKNVCVMTDASLVKLEPVKAVLDSLTKSGVRFQVYDKVRVEPTDRSIAAAVDFARRGEFDAFVAVGGGSVMDTCKLANLFHSDREAALLDYVNPPVGKGKPITKPLYPLIAIPTTTGTGSESTGVGIFDLETMHAKTGIANRALRPTLGIIDPQHALTQPERVVSYSGFDVFCHALESFTATPYWERGAAPQDPLLRPLSQGSNPISDEWARYCLRTIRSYFERAVYRPDDLEARANMHLAATMAGVGIGIAGAHLCHGLSYSISGLVKNYQPEGYSKDHPIIPHGLSVVMTAPAVFKYTASSNPDRHLEAASLLGADVANSKKADAGLILSDIIRKYMDVMKVENGLSALEFTRDDIPELVTGTLPQGRLLNLSPKKQTEEDLYNLFADSMQVY